MADFLLKTSNAPGWEISLYLSITEANFNDTENKSDLSVGLYIYSRYDIGPWGNYNGSYLGIDTSTEFSGAISKGSGVRWLVQNRTFTIYHNSDGSKIQPIYWKWGVNSSWGGFVYPSGIFNYECTKIDRSAPNVSFKYDNVTPTSFTYTAESSDPADWAKYSLDGGATWSDCSGGGTINGLAPNTTYDVAFKLRKTSNNVWGTSDTQKIKTIGGSIINSAKPIDADNNFVDIVVGVTVYNGSYYNEIEIKNGTKTILTTNQFVWSTGTSSRTIRLTSEQRSLLLASMKNEKTFNATLCLKTYGTGFTQIGNDSSVGVLVQTSSSNSAPTFSNWTYKDNDPYTIYATGNNQILLKNASSLLINCDAAIAKNGASIISYTAAIGENTKTDSTKNILVGTVNNFGELPCTVTATDSRGYTASVTKKITVLDYAPPKIISYILRRENDIDANIQLKFNGEISPIVFNSTNKNSIYIGRYRYKKTSEPSWGSYISILLNIKQPIDGKSFSFDSLELASLDVDSSWDFHIQIQDQCRDGTVFNEYTCINPKKPHFSIRKGKVGINNPNPTCALDINGEIKMNSFYVMGYVGDIEDDFNNYKTGGIFAYHGGGASNAPLNAAGILEVLTAMNGYVIQRFTQYADGCAVYVRSLIKNATWSEWHQK